MAGRMDDVWLGLGAHSEWRRYFDRTWPDPCGRQYLYGRVSANQKPPSSARHFLRIGWLDRPLIPQWQKFTRLPGWPMAIPWFYVHRLAIRQSDGKLSAFRTACGHFMLNCSLVGYTYGPPLVQRFAISQRDKYGQGRDSGTMPVMRGEFWQIDGAEQVWLMSFDD